MDDQAAVGLGRSHLVGRRQVVRNLVVGQGDSGDREHAIAEERPPVRRDLIVQAEIELGQDRKGRVMAGNVETLEPVARVEPRAGFNVVSKDAEFRCGIQAEVRAPQVIDPHATADRPCCWCC